jgi:N6-adenosine-specific RNA methylase IME4
MELVLYDNACRALAEARSVDEVKHIRNSAIAMRAYARQAKNKDLEADAWEIRKRATRKLGEMMEVQPKAKGGEHGGKAALDGARAAPSNPTPTLAEAGIDKHLAKEARGAAAMSVEDFETLVADGRAEARKSAERAVESKINRKEKHQGIAARAIAVEAPLGPFPLIYADPPWKWSHFGEPDQENEKGKGRTPDQHYPTLTHADICNFRVGDKLVREIAFKDAALLLWCTSANILLAMEAMTAWGFEYKAQAVWVKDKPGMGLVFRNRHEVLLYGTCGAMPGPQYQPPSVFMFPRGKHSAKPPEIRKEIERMYPDFGEAQRLELFARGNVEGWTTYGYETNT